MVARRPLVLVNGKPDELPLADTLAGGGGTPSFPLVEVDLGTPAKRSGTFTIAGLSGLTVGKPVNIWVSTGPFTGKGFTTADEGQMYALALSAVVIDAATIRVWWSSRHLVRGNVKFNYAIGG